MSATQKSLLALLLSFALQMLHAQHISCFDAKVIKDKSTLNIPSTSDYNLPNTGLIGCFQDTLHQAHWFKFTALTSGTFKFAVTADNLAADYDFVLFSEACPCDTMASQIVACNWVGLVTNPPYTSTGISSNPAVDFGVTDPMAGLEFEQTVNVQANKNYYLIIDNITNNGVGFKMEFGGTAQIGAPLPEPLPTVGQLKGNTEICSGLSGIYEVPGDVRFSNYEWSVPTGTTVSGSGKQVVLTFGENSGKVRVIARNSCLADTSFLDVKVNKMPNLELKEAPYFCKNACFELKNLQLSEKNNLSNLDFKIYNKKSDAYLGSNQNVAPSMICQEQNLWLRATSNKNCFDTLQFKIREMENPSVALFGGGVACFGDTVNLSFSFTGQAPFEVTYTDGTNDWNFTTNQPIFTEKNIIDQSKTIKVKSFKESSNVCTSKIVGEAQFFASVNCQCLKKAGTMNNLPLDACSNQNVKGIHNMNEIKGANDALIFILHNVSTPDLATVFASNKTPDFSFVSGLMPEMTYYIAAVVGNKKPNGDIDFADPCLGISVGVPVVFHKAPSAFMTADSLICSNQLTDLTLTPNGQAPFMIYYGNSFIDKDLSIDKITVFKESIGDFYVKKIIDATGCSSTYTDTISIRAPKKLSFLSKKFQCNAANTSYQVVLDVTGGEANTCKEINGKGVFAKNTYTSDFFASGQNFNIAITDKNACDTLFVADKHTCACTAKSTPATLNPLPITICESLAATASFNPDQKLVGTDIQGYILHDGDANTIGNILDYNTLPQFAKKSGMSNNKPYFIASVAGSPDANGKVDVKSPCAAFGKGSVPIVFVEEPSAALAGTTELCEGEKSDLKFILTGTTPFELVYNDGQSNQKLDKINDFSFSIPLKNTSTTYNLVSVKTSGTPGCQGKILNSQNTLNVTLLAALTNSQPKINCSTDKKTYQVAFDINGGKSNTYSVDLKPISGNSFLSKNINDGDAYNFTIESAANCKPLIISGKGYCSCPPDVAASIKISSAIKCHNDNNGVLSIDVKNLKAPYDITWSNGSKMEKIENLTAGIYKVSITNLDNCSLKDSFILKNPEPIRSSATVTDVRCFGENTGKIVFGLTEGGTIPYSYSIDNQLFTEENIFTKLKSNRYELVVKDANGCRWEDEAELLQPEEFYINLGEDQIINLGTETQLQAIVSAPYDSLVWSDKTVNGLTHSFTPMKSQEFKVTVTDKKGCKASDVLWVYVKSEREVFAPNTFSPNNDGTNDSFTIYGGSDVAKVKDLQVFDRWGNMIYQVQDIAPNDENMGWQGSQNGHLANQDHYIYKTTVEFVDGKTKDFTGEVLLMR